MNNALYDITAHIDEDILSATIDKPSTASGKTHWKKWIALAACLGVCMAITVIGGRLTKSNIAKSETDSRNSVTDYTSAESGVFAAELTEAPTLDETESKINNTEQKKAGYVQSKTAADAVLTTENNKHEEAEKEQSSEINEEITADNNGQKGAAPENGECNFWWNNLSINGALKNAIDNNPNGTFKVLAAYRPATADITSFEYEGKSLSEWAVAAYEEDAGQEAKNEYRLAYNAYLEAVMPSFVNQLSSNNISCSRAEYANNAIVMNVTAEQLKVLPLSNLEYWVFDLASEDMKGASNE